MQAPMFGSSRPKMKKTGERVQQLQLPLDSEVSKSSFSLLSQQPFVHFHQGYLVRLRLS